MLLHITAYIANLRDKQGLSVGVEKNQSDSKYKIFVHLVRFQWRNSVNVLVSSTETRRGVFYADGPGLFNALDPFTGDSKWRCNSYLQMFSLMGFQACSS